MNTIWAQTKHFKFIVGRGMMKLARSQTLTHMGISFSKMPLEAISFENLQGKHTFSDSQIQAPKFILKYL